MKREMVLDEVEKEKMYYWKSDAEKRKKKNKHRT